MKNNNHNLRRLVIAAVCILLLRECYFRIAPYSYYSRESDNIVMVAEFLCEYEAQTDEGLFFSDKASLDWRGKLVLTEEMTTPMPKEIQSAIERLLHSRLCEKIIVSQGICTFSVNIGRKSYFALYSRSDLSRSTAGGVFFDILPSDFTKMRPHLFYFSQ